MALGDGIRRNIAHVDPAERELFRDALVELNNRLFPGDPDDFPPGGVSWWFKQDEIHQATHVHGGPDFLPWHRELLNRFEARLREINPLLSLHYWDWTQDPRSIPDANLGGGTTGILNLFTSDFMGYGGLTNASIGEPWLSARYYVPGAANHRDNRGAAYPPRDVFRRVNGSPALVSEDDGVQEAAHFAEMRGRLEDVHNNMHGFVNMGSRHRSFEDPFVFLLHSNVDRLFARWQTDPDHPERLEPETVYGPESGHADLNSNIEPWSGGSGTRPWGPPESLGVPKTCKHPSIVTPPRYDTNHPPAVWSRLVINSPALRDSSGWNDITNYSTIQTAVVNDELYLLARANAGMHTWKFGAGSTTWTRLSTSSPRWADDNGWSDVTNYSTIQTAVVNNELYLLARADAGMHTWKFDAGSTTWTRLSANTPRWADDNGWSNVTNYSTIQTAVVNDELYLLARANAGMHTWKFDAGSATWTRLSANTPRWADDNGWSDVTNYSTIQTAVVNDELYLLARANAGMHTWRFDAGSATWTRLSANTPRWADDNGWGDVTNYATIQTAVVNDELHLLARANRGMLIWRFNAGDNSWTRLAANRPTWSDDLGWSDDSNYTTIQTAVVNDELYLLARADAGMHTWKFVG